MMYDYLSAQYANGFSQVVFEGGKGETAKTRRTLDMMGFPTIYDGRGKRLICVIDKGFFKGGVWKWMTV